MNIRVKLIHCIAALMTSIACQSAIAACANTSVTGTWGYNYSSIDFNNSEFCAGLGLFTFSGSDRLKVVAGKDSCNGSISSSTAQGTYSLSSACTGTASVVFNSGSTGRYHFVLNDKKTIDFILLVKGFTLHGEAQKR